MHCINENLMEYEALGFSSPLDLQETSVHIFILYSCSNYEKIFNLKIENKTKIHFQSSVTFFTFYLISDF